MARPVQDLNPGTLDGGVADALTRAGLLTVADVVRAGIEGIVARTDLDARTARAVVEAAQELRGAADAAEPPPPTPVRLVDPETPDAAPPGPPRNAVARGLALARRLQSTAELAHRARRRVKKADAKGRKKCRKQLKRLLHILRDIERDALATGAGAPLVEDCRSILAEADDHLLAFLEHRRARTRHVKRLRKQTRHTRRRFEAMLRGDVVTGDAPSE